VASIVSFYSLYYDHAAGQQRIQICTDLPCALRGADKFADDLCKKFGVKLGETTKDGQFTIEGVMCLAACDRAPMFQVQNKDGIFYHENQTVESAVKVIESLKSK
jgi:NADH-quinone oxidoreductase subunit E